MTTRPIYDDSIGLSRAMQQRLQTQIAQNNGAIDQVAASVQAQLTALDADGEMQKEQNRPQYQSQRALLLAELDYLALVANRQQEQESSRSGTFWARFRRPFQRTPVTE